MKSTNSAFSDYNFLFENIDQTLNQNNQMMLQELLYQQNSSNNLKVAQQQQNSTSPTPEVQTLQSLQQNRHATISVNDVCNNVDCYKPVTLGREEEEEEEESKDEIISIEDTYRETAAVIGADDRIPNKSMTIIQEENSEYEESQFIMSNYPHRSNMMKSLTLQKQSADQSLKEHTLGAGLQPQFTNTKSNFRDSYETFGGNNVNSGLNNDLDFLEEKGSTFNSLQNKF